MSNQQTEDRLKAHLKHWDEELPPSVAGKLRAARRDAMATEPRSRKGRWVPVMAAASAADDNAVPTLDFLEFLSEWESQDGDWLDPLLAESSTPPTGQPVDPENSSEKKQ